LSPLGVKNFCNTKVFLQILALIGKKSAPLKLLRTAYAAASNLRHQAT